MISVAELKQLIYQETGYKIQIQDNDPILAAFYVNLATLGEALKHAERIQTATQEVINSLPGAANLEMQRASEKALRALSTEVGRIAQSVAGDSIAIEKAKAISKATKLATIGAASCALIFGAVGYVFSMSNNKLEIYAARAQVKAAWEQSNKAIADAQRNKTWIDTESGKQAYHFYTTSWPLFANCSGGSMEKVGKNGCRMVQKFGWLSSSENPAWYTGPATK